MHGIPVSVTVSGGCFRRICCSFRAAKWLSTGSLLPKGGLTWCFAEVDSAAQHVVGDGGDIEWVTKGAQGVSRSTIMARCEEGTSMVSSVCDVQWMADSEM